MTTSLDSELFNLMRPLRESTNCYRNGIWHNCRTMHNSLRSSPNHFMFCVRMITHHDTRSRTRISRSKGVCTIGRIPDVPSRIVYTSQVTLLTVSIVLDSQIIASRWNNVTYRRDSIRGANLTALRTSLPQATLGTYVESSRSMPTPYGLVPTSQNSVKHHLTISDHLVLAR
jgi:hypothetical protein